MEDALRDPDALEHALRVAPELELARVAHPDGRIGLSAPLDALKRAHRSITVRFPQSQHRPPAAPGVLHWDGAGQDWTAVCGEEAGQLHATVAGWGAQVVAERAPTLDELFVAHVGMHASSGAEA